MSEYFEFEGVRLPFDITEVQTARRLQLAVDELERGIARFTAGESERGAAGLAKGESERGAAGIAKGESERGAAGLAKGESERGAAGLAANESERGAAGLAANESERGEERRAANESERKAAGLGGEADEGLRFCELVRAFFDCAVGAGAAAKLFGLGRSAAECERAFLALVDCVNSQQEKTRLRREALYSAAITPAWEKQ